MDVEDAVREHYRREDLIGVVTDALRRAGADMDALRVEDLAGLDQLHAGSVLATEHVLDALALTSQVRLLDVGSGVGGPARLAAARYGCRVTGVDLSADFVEVARYLTDRVRLGGAVSFEVGSALELPFDDASFERAVLTHVGMNIADKRALFDEVRRVLAGDGRFVLYEQMRTGDGELAYPMPWADDAGSSFVERRETYGELLRAAGFVVERDEDLAPLLAAAGPPVPGTLTPADLFGHAFAERMSNNLTAALGGILRPVMMVARVA